MGVRIILIHHDFTLEASGQQYRRSQLFILVDGLGRVRYTLEALIFVSIKNDLRNFLYAATCDFHVRRS